MDRFCEQLADDLSAFALAEVDAVGIAAADRFTGAPAGTRPTDLMPACQSVVVFACKHLDVLTTTRNLDCQAYSQDVVNREVLHQAYRIARFIERHGFLAFPLVASVSLRPFVEDEALAAGQISLRHAAELAGLGRIGRNALLVTPEFGPRVQLGAILTDAMLPADPLLETHPCTGCHHCIIECPANALREPVSPDAYTPVDRERCLAYRGAHGGQSPLGYKDACGICRAVCPVGKKDKSEVVISL